MIKQTRALIAILLAAAASASAADVTLLNVSYDPTRELWRDINDHFVPQYKKEKGDNLTIKQSHGGSSSQARAVINGLDADVVTLASAINTDAIAKKGLITGDWSKRLPHNSLPYYSTIVFVVRKGNPKGIKDWPDLVKLGVEIITPNPKTSGNGYLSFFALLKRVRLDGLHQRYPGQLSGGQRQRVALARALAAEPRVLLLDEPFGALDAKVRQELRQWLRQLHEEIHVTSIFVTHDQEEAMELADRVVIMNRGRIEQMGSTDDLYKHPRSAFVFDFLGDTIVLPAEVRDGHVYLPGTDKPFAARRDHANGPVDVYVRPGDLRFAEPSALGFDVRVTAVQRTGPIVRAWATAPTGVTVTVELPHLHHDVPRFVEEATLRLRLMQLSLYPRGERVVPVTLEPPVLIGRERERRVD